MKKVFCTIVLMLLIATTSYAQATFSMTGSYWAEGKYWFNYNDAPGTDATYSERSFGFYEQDINLYPKITMENTSLNFRIAITDVYWGAPDADGSEGINQTAPDTNANDDNIQIERAYLSHNFGKVTLDVGLMNGTQWATTFADDNQAQWRVKAVARTPVGIVGAVLEKNREWGAEDNDLEGEDRDSYGLFAITKAGPVFVKPLLWYVRVGGPFQGSALEPFDGSGTKFTIFNPVLGFDGDLGVVSFESEINYKMYSLESSSLDVDEDWSTLGLYLNVWKALDAMTPGLVLAYGSFDDTLGDAVFSAAAGGNTFGAGALRALSSTAAFDFEDDFYSTIILGDEYGWGGGDDLAGMTLIKLYVNDIATGIDPLTLNFYAAYIMSNQEATDAALLPDPLTIPNNYEDATAWEASLGADYKITDNLKYSIYGAYADISYDVTGIDDPESVYILANAITFTF